MLLLVYFLFSWCWGATVQVNAWGDGDYPPPSIGPPGIFPLRANDDLIWEDSRACQTLVNLLEGATTSWWCAPTSLLQPHPCVNQSVLYPSCFAPYIITRINTTKSPATVRVVGISLPQAIIKDGPAAANNISMKNIFGICVYF
jgi:hypothetical protein